LGGDLEHTHLVKGLDYALLQKVKAELETKVETEKPLDLDAEPDEEEEEELVPKKVVTKAKVPGIKPPTVQK
jgi:IK cytokine